MSDVDTHGDMRRGRFDELSLPTQSRVRRYSHDEAADRMIGRRGSFKGWLSGQDRAAELYRQSHDIAEKLLQARNPIDLFAAQHALVTAEGLVTGEQIVLASSRFKASTFLPCVAVEKRRPKFDALRVHIESSRRVGDAFGQGSVDFRYLVATGGRPVAAFGDLRAAISGLVRRISKAGNAALEHWDGRIRFQCSSIEYTRQRRDGGDAGPFSYHVHANITVMSDGCSEREWDEFLVWFSDRLGSHCHDDGSIKDARKLMRYIYKPADLYSAHPDELAWLYRQTKQARFFSAYSDFKGVLKGIEESGRKVASVGGRSALVQKSSSLSRHRDIDDIESDEEQYYRELDEDVRELDAEATAEQRATRNLTVRRDEVVREPQQNMLLGFTLPQARFSPWREPLALVRNLQSGAGSFDLRAAIDEARPAALAAWTAAGAPDPADALHVAECLRDAVNVDATCGYFEDLHPRAVEIENLTVREADAEPEAHIVHSSSLTVSEPENHQDESTRGVTCKRVANESTSQISETRTDYTLMSLPAAKVLDHQQAQAQFTRRWLRFVEFEKKPRAIFSISSPRRRKTVWYDDFDNQALAA